MPQPVKFVLFDISKKLVEEWTEAFRELVPQECQEHVKIVHSGLEELNMSFDCIVSPANSFARFDGSFDQVLSDTLAPEENPDALTETGQAVLYKRWRGFAPPGTCTLIPLTGSPCEGNPFKCRFVALCPTMRFPSSVTWHKEIVYNCVWSLLVEIDQHNARAEANPDTMTTISTVVMTGLATGVGGVSADVCAKHTALAFAHFHDAQSNPKKWCNISWGDVIDMPIDKVLRNRT